MAADRLDLLRRVPLFAQMKEQVLAGLVTHLRRHTYRKGTMIFHKDQVGDALYIVESGRIRIFLPAEGGEEFTVDILGPGDVFGELALLDGRPRSASADTLEDSVAYTLSRTDFQSSLAQSPEMASALLELLSRWLRNVMHHAETLAFLDVHARVARILLDMAQRHGIKEDGIVINIELTQGQIATMVGATRERINRALASFRSQGLIELRGKKIVILDSKRLSERIY